MSFFCTTREVRKRDLVNRWYVSAPSYARRPEWARRDHITNAARSFSDVPLRRSQRSHSRCTRAGASSIRHRRARVLLSFQPFPHFSYRELCRTDVPFHRDFSRETSPKKLDLFATGKRPSGDDVTIPRPSNKRSTTRSGGFSTSSTMAAKKDSSPRRSSGPVSPAHSLSSAAKQHCRALGTTAAPSIGHAYAVSTNSTLPPRPSI